jgi:hypothetical protein
MGEAQVGGETPGEVITARVVMTLEDLTAAWDALAGKRRKIRAASTLGTVALFWLWPAISGESGIFWNVAGGAVVLLTGSAVVRSFFRTRSKWAHDTLAQSRAAEGVEFTFDRQTFGFKGPGREARVAWSVLWGQLETADAFLIIVAPRAANVVPKRGFAPEDLPRVREYLSAIVPKRMPKEARSPARIVGYVGLACYVVYKLAESGFIAFLISTPSYKTRVTERHVNVVARSWCLQNNTTGCPTLAQLVDAKLLTKTNSVDSWGHPFELA